MAAEAEAAREARAKVIAAEGEHKSSRALANAAEIISQTPAALQVGFIGYRVFNARLDTQLRSILVGPNKEKSIFRRLP